MTARRPLDCFFNPASVAVIGASTVLHKTGGRRWRSMVEGGFPGPLYPIHPTAREILGRRAYASLRDVPGPVELAIVLVRPELVPAAVAECATLGVSAVCVITAGFGETGPEGKRIERQLATTVRASGARMIGPNCAGLFSASGRVNALGWSVPSGPVGVISQSGNMVLTFTQLARRRGLGFSKLVTVGNAADVGIHEHVDYLFGDPDTRVVVAYLEGFEPGEGRALVELMRAHPTPKPLVVIKPGETESGKRAALSHTGALAGEHRIVDAAFRQSGILRVAESDDAWDAAIALALAPPLARRSVAVISDGGGHATIVADTADRVGLDVACLSTATQRRLREILPPRCTVVNPIDFAGVAEEEPDVVPRVLEVCLADTDVGGAILAGHFGGYVNIATDELGRRETAAAEAIVDVVRRHAKPVILHTVYGGDPLPALETLRAAGVPTYRSLEAAAKAMGALAAASMAPHCPRSQCRSSPDASRVRDILARAIGRAPAMLLEPDARALLAAYGVPASPYRVATTPEETAAAASELGTPVALKLIAPGLVHKSEAGGVLLGVAASGAACAHQQLMARADALGLHDARVLVAPMIADGVEVVVGGLRDPQFGPVVMVGLGGVWVEALGDVVFRVAPVDEHEARAMLAEVRGHRLFGAFRGRPERDVAAAADAVIRVGELMLDLPGVVELDVNPLFLLERGVAVGDARVVLAEGRA